MHLLSNKLSFTQNFVIMYFKYKNHTCNKSSDGLINKAFKLNFEKTNAYEIAVTCCLPVGGINKIIYISPIYVFKWCMQ